MIPIRDINPTRSTPVVTLVLIAINVAVFFFIQQAREPAAEVEFLYERAVIACEITDGGPISLREVETARCGLAGEPIFPNKNVYLAAFTSMFLHGGLLHVLGNVWFLWIFGNNVEEAYGKVGYLLLYLGAGLAATGGFIALNPGSTLPLIGASGAIAGVLGAYALLFPRHRVLALIFVVFVPVPSMLFLALWFGSQFLVQSEAVAWEAHVVGFLFGMAATAVFRRRLLERLARLHRPLQRFPEI